MKCLKFFYAAVCLSVFFLHGALRVHATEMVYTPVNPSFGGNPLNGPVLLNSANAQNKYKESTSSSYAGYKVPTALDTFKEVLNK